jgi:hypothetical protein
MANRGDYGSYIPTTQVWDVSEIYETEVTSPQFKELIVRLYQNINAQSMSINGRSSGMYDTSEFVNGHTYFPNPALNSTTAKSPQERQVFRKVINFGALLNAGEKTVAHGITITDDITFTHIYGTANDPINHYYLPLPYASPAALNENIKLKVVGNNVSVTTGDDRTGYTVTYIVLEYLKS